MSVEAAMTQNSSTQKDRLFPLGDFYRARGWSMPEHHMVAANDVPQPYHTLLVHKGDMTSALQNFHSQKIRIEALEFLHQGNKVMRQVRLCDTASRPVEFGASEINLSCFHQNAQEEILASILPLGAILHKFGLSYISTPQAYFSIQSDAHIESALKLDTPAKLWGRVNVLRTAQQRIFAKVVEILPPLRAENDA